MNAAEKAAAEALAKAQQQAQMAQMANQRIERVRQQAFAQAFNETLVNLVNAQIRLQAELADLVGEIGLPLLVMRDRTLDMGAITDRRRRRTLKCRPTACSGLRGILPPQ